MEDDADPSPEVLGFLVAQVTHDLDGRPFGRSRPGPPALGRELAHHRVQERGEARELAAGLAEERDRIRHDRFLPARPATSLTFRGPASQTAPIDTALHANASQKAGA
jgi:hypothetical protein